MLKFPKTKMSQKTIITFQNNILAPQINGNGARFVAYHLIPIISRIMIKL